MGLSNKLRISSVKMKVNGSPRHCLCHGFVKVFHHLPDGLELSFEGESENLNVCGVSFKCLPD